MREVIGAMTKEKCVGSQKPMQSPEQGGLRCGLKRVWRMGGVKEVE